MSEYFKKPYVWFLISAIILGLVIPLLFYDARFISIEGLKGETNIIGLIIAPLTILIFWLILYLLTEFIYKVRFFIYFALIHFCCTVLMPVHLYLLSLALAKMTSLNPTYKFYDRFAYYEMFAFTFVQIIALVFILFNFINAFILKMRGHQSSQG